MIYNAVLVSGIAQSESYTHDLHIHIATLFRFFSRIGHYRVLTRVLYAIHKGFAFFGHQYVHFYWLYILLQLTVLSRTVEIYCFLSQKEPSVKYG